MKKLARLLSIGIFVFLFGFPLFHADAALINANGVLGQPDYTTNTIITPPTTDSLDGPSYLALDPVDHRLFVADQVNNRVLVYPLDTNNNITTKTATYVFGQPDFVSNSPHVDTQNGFNGEHGLAYDSTYKRLFVADQSNSRVLVFDAAPATLLANGYNENAFAVIGQSTFGTHVGSAAKNRLKFPRGVAYDTDNKRLFVAEQTNDRVTVFDVSPAALTAVPMGEDAEAVLGQASYTAHVAADTQDGMTQPAGVAYDSTYSRLFVSDFTNNRVTVYDASPTAQTNTPIGEFAEYVFGQTSFVTATPATTKSGMNTPRGVTYDSTNTRLFVTDSTNARVLVFDATPSTMTSSNYGKDAENVIGQSDFVTGNITSTQNGLSGFVRGPVYNPTYNSLFVVDADNNRVLQIPMIHLTTASLPSGTNGTAYSQTLAIVNYQGTSQSFSVSSGTLPTGLSLNSSTGAITGTPTGSGTSSFTIEADDVFSTGNFIDRATYSLTIAIPAYTLTYIAGAHGSIDGTSPQTVNSGSDGSLVTAVPASHYHFVNWSDTLSTSTARTDTTVSRDITATANFAIDTFALTYTAGSGGSITGTSPQTVNYGDDGTAVTAVPDSGYSFSGWSDSISTNPRTDTAVTGDLSVSATFTAIPVVSHGGGHVFSILPSGINGQPLDFAINNGEKTTNSPVLKLTLNADPSTVTGYAVSLDPKFTNSVIIPYTSTGTFTLPNVSGAYTIYLEYFSTTGNHSSTISHSITLTTTGVLSAHYTFTRTLHLSMTGADVRQLQIFLNTHGSIVSSTGAGSPGNETTYFGQRTFNALVKYQSANGIKPTSGFFGPITMGVVNALLQAGK